MDHHTPLIATLSVGFVLAFILGALANRLKMSPLVGYLMAGVIVGPFTPGFVADAKLSHEISEIGVILLMFGVGLHFSFKDLMSVKAIAVPGAIVQIALATLMGMGLAWALGWSIGTGLVFGLALSVASTVVLLRALESQDLLETRRGKIAVGWLIVEDLVMVLALVLLPALSGMLGGKVQEGGGSLLWQLATTLLKVAAFVAIMMIFGRKSIPWLLERVAGTGSRELFILLVLALAMGIAYGSVVLFGVSFALGAFFAGMVLNESELSHRAAEESLPLRDAFAVLFFVSVGFLFNPMILVEHPLAIFFTFLIIVIGKSIAALTIVMLFRKPLRTALTISISLSQIGEFSFILANLGVQYELLPSIGRDFILAGAILSILVNPLLIVLMQRFDPWIERFDRRGEDADVTASPLVQDDKDEVPQFEALEDHTIVVGYGQTGRLICEHLHRAGEPFVVIDVRVESCDDLRGRGYNVVRGNAAREQFLENANIRRASRLLVTISSIMEAGQITLHARHANPDVEIIACIYDQAEEDYLKDHEVDVVISGPSEVAAVVEEYLDLEPAPH